MVHTRLLKTTKEEVKKLAKQNWVHANVVINTLLEAGLKGGIMAKKNAAKKVTKKTSKKKY